MAGRQINDELETIWKEAVILLEWLGKTTTNLSEDTRDGGRDSNRVPTEYAFKALPLPTPISYDVGFL
jgi:hypothetical protein